MFYNSRGRAPFRGGRRPTYFRRGGGRGGLASKIKKDPCSIYVSFVNPIEAVCASQLIQVAHSTGASLKFGRHCYLTFGTESEASSILTKAAEMEFGGLKPYVDHAYKSQSAKAEKREAEVNVQSPAKKMKSNSDGTEEVETMEHDMMEGDGRMGHDAA